MWIEEVVAGRPAWRHVASGVVFRAMPGGTFRMGLSEAELEAVRAIERSGGAEDTLEPFFAGRHYHPDFPWEQQARRGSTARRLRRRGTDSRR